MPSGRWWIRSGPALSLCVGRRRETLKRLYHSGQLDTTAVQKILAARDRMAEAHHDFTDRNAPIACGETEPLHFDSGIGVEL